MTIAKKILNVSQLRRKIPSLRRKGKTIAFTNGCFDILHYGHISYLQKAKNNQRILIVGLNSDTSVRKIKGRGRPINKQKARAEVLAALACVDFVTIFSDDTPLKLMKALRPDVILKGADYKNKQVIGEEFVESYGGKVELVKFIPSYSSTKIISAIQKTCKN